MNNYLPTNTKQYWKIFREDLITDNINQEIKVINPGIILIYL